MNGEELIVVLFQDEQRNEAGKLIDYRKITCGFNEYGGFYMVCCDINPTAKKMYDSSSVEFCLSVKPVAVYKLASKLKADYGNLQNSLLSIITKKFTGDGLFDEFEEYCKSSGIPYDFDVW